MREISIAITGMHCASCGILVDDCMLDVPGVVTSVTDTRTGECRVQAEDAVQDAALLAAVTEAGYTGILS